MKTQKIIQECRSKIIHRSQKCKKSKGPSIDKEIKKMWYNQSMEYYLAIKGMVVQ